MFSDVKAIVEIKVGEDLVSTVYITDLEKGNHWIKIAENSRILMDITAIHLLPHRGAKWDGQAFDLMTHHSPLPGLIYFAFIVDDVCVYVQHLDPSDSDDAATIAAYKSGPTFEVHYGPVV